MLQTSAGELELRLGDGVGGFEPPTTLQLSTSPAYLEVCDFEGDGDLDLITVEQQGATELFRNDGFGGFSVTGVQLPFPTLTYRRVTFADGNGDGLVDLYASFTLVTVRSLRVYEGRPDGTFVPTTEFPLDANPLSNAAVGDLTSDGIADVVLMTAGGAPYDLRVLRGDGEGGLVQIDAVDVIEQGKVLLRDRPVGSKSSGDGDLDVLVLPSWEPFFGLSTSLEQPHGLHVFENDGLGALQEAGLVATPEGYLRQLGDFDGDGFEDLVLVDGESPAPWAFAVGWGDGAGGFDLPTYAPFALPYPLDVSQIELVDLDRDGHLDVLGAVFSTDAGLLVQRGDGSGSFESESLELASTTIVRSFAVGDFDGDCWLDVVVQDALTNDLQLYLREGEELALSWTSEAPGSATRWLVPTDFSGDGLLDLVVNGTGANQAAILLGDGAGSLQDPVQFSLMGNLLDCDPGDYDGDGVMDLLMQSQVVGMPTHFQLQLNLGDGTGTGILPAVVISDVDVEGQVESLDLDQDGDLDVVYIASNGSLRWLRNDGGLVFTTTTLGGPGWEHFDVGDVDGDGDLDVLGEGRLSVENLGLGQFSEDLQAFPELAPRTLATHAGDVDEDGHLDVVVGAEQGFLLQRNLGPEFDGTCQPNLGFDGPGPSTLRACGDDLELGGRTDLVAEFARPGATLFLFCSTRFCPTCLLGADVVPIPTELLLRLPVGPSGRATLAGIEGVGIEFSLYVQGAYLDASLPSGFGLTNVVRLDFLP